MNEIKAFIRVECLENVLETLYAHPEFPGITISEVFGYGHSDSARSESDLLRVHMLKLECIATDAISNEVVQMIGQAARTGGAGDGRISVHRLQQVVKIGTGKAVREETE